MTKLLTIVLLLTGYCTYSYWIYNTGTDSQLAMSPNAIAGKRIWQSNNCQNCHQIFGLGGYMGPDLTNVISDNNRGAAYAKAMITAGGNRMPAFHLSAPEAEALMAWLAYADQLSRNSTNR